MKLNLKRRIHACIYHCGQDVETGYCKEVAARSHLHLYLSRIKSVLGAFSCLPWRAEQCFYGHTQVHDFEMREDRSAN